MRPLLATLPFILALLSAGHAYGQFLPDGSIREAARARGIKFGSLTGHLYDPYNQSLYQREIDASTVITLMNEVWGNPTYYDFTTPDTGVYFGEYSNWELHGHSLIVGQANGIPSWMPNGPSGQARNLLETFIRDVVGRYRNRVRIWHVVNEAIADEGYYRNDYWNREMSAEYIAHAFKAAEAANPNAILIYNEYNMENNTAKFNTMISMLNYVRSLGARVDGVGWQLHTEPEVVLDENYQLEARMQVISNMGLTNYITELDVPLINNSPSQLYRQKQAYRKLIEIFLRNPTHADSLTVWDLSDKYSWLGISSHANLFDENFNQKPAYQGVFDAFADFSNGQIQEGQYRLKNLWTETYLNQSDLYPTSIPNLQPYQEFWGSQKWQISNADAGSHRITCQYGGLVLENTGNYDFGTVMSSLRINSRWSQMWYFESVGGGIFRSRTAGLANISSEIRHLARLPPATTATTGGLKCGCWRERSSTGRGNIDPGSAHPGK